MQYKMPRDGMRRRATNATGSTSNDGEEARKRTDYPW